MMHKTAQTAVHVQLAGVVEITRTVQLHQHPLLEFVYYLEGEARCQIGDMIVDCYPGMLRLIPPQVIHGEIVSTPITCLYIWLQASSHMRWPQVYVDDTTHTIRTICTTIISEWKGQARHRDDMLDTLIAQMDILLLRANDQPRISMSERVVREAERLLQQLFTTPVTIGEIAATLGVSPSYLRRHFVELRSQTPIAYLQTLRVQHALALIQTSDLSLEAVARLCGYDSSSHLSRQVKGATGARPGTFRMKANK